MTLLKPPGPLAIALGCNGIATCDCGSDCFHGMVKVTETAQILKALKCAKCDKETTVPLDTMGGRKFQS